MNSALPIISILIGALILLFGRRLFWLFVAAIGFAIGMQLTPYLVHNPPPWLALAVAIILGIIGAVLALALQKVAIAIGGFLIGGHVATAIATAFVNTHAQYFGLTFIIGGIIGALLLLVLSLFVSDFFVSDFLAGESPFSPLPEVLDTVSLGAGLRPAFVVRGSGAEAAIDIEHRAGHEGGFGAGEEHDAGRHFLRLAEALQGVQAALRLGELAAILRIHLGVDRAGLHHVDGDAARAEVARRALGVADDGSLAGDVVGKTREGGAIGEHGADGDDAAAFAHQF